MSSNGHDLLTGLAVTDEITARGQIGSAVPSFLAGALPIRHRVQVTSSGYNDVEMFENKTTRKKDHHY